MKMRNLLTPIFGLLLLVGCSKARQPTVQSEMLDWQRLKGVEWYWKSERTNFMKSLDADLRCMSEPTFSNATTNQLAGHFYRFQWWRTFHKPIIVTIASMDDGRQEVRTKIYAGPGGWKLGELERQVTVTNKSETTATLLAQLDRWLICVPEFDGSRGPDGAEWIIDGVHNGRYSMVHRWSPESGWVRETGLRFLKAANIEEKDIY